MGSGTSSNSECALKNFDFGFEVAVRSIRSHHPLSIYFVLRFELSIVHFTTVIKVSSSSDSFDLWGFLSSGSTRLGSKRHQRDYSRDSVASSSVNH